MPTGRMMCSSGSGAPRRNTPSTSLRFTAKKSKYLNTPSVTRLTTTARVTQRRAAAREPRRPPSARCTCTPSAWLTSVAAMSRKTSRQSHQP